MPSYQRNKIRFESTELNQETGRCVTMAQYDCVPPPAGRESGFQYVSEVHPMINPQYLQRSELRGMLAGAENAGEVLDSAGLLTDLAAHFNFNKLTIDEANLPPEYRNNSRCFTVLLAYQVVYTVWEIKAVAAETFTAGNTTWPKDDTVAVFRILVPFSYSFRRDYEWNPACCQGDRRIKDPDTVGPFPKRYIIEFMPPQNWNHKWDWDLRFRAEYRDKPEDEDDH